MNKRIKWAALAFICSLVLPVMLWAESPYTQHPRVPAMAVPGTLIKTVTLPVPGFGVSVAVDCDGNVYYTNSAPDKNLYKMDKNGLLLDTRPILDAASGAPVEIDEIAWDDTRKVLWGVEHGSNPVKVWQITPAGAATLQFTSATVSVGSFRDGLAFDGGNQTLWISGDVSTTVEHYSAGPPGVLGPLGFQLPTITPKNAGGGNLGSISGVIVGTLGGVPILYLGQNGLVKIVRVRQDNGNFIDDFSSPGGGRDEGLECDAVNFTPLLALWSRDVGGFINVIELEPGTCACGGGGCDKWRLLSNLLPAPDGSKAPTSGVEGAAGGVIGTKLYISHGYRGFDSRKLDIYDITAGTWTSGPDANFDRSEMAGGVACGKFYAIGGRTAPNQAKTECYDPVANSWATVADLNFARGGLGAASVGGLIYAVGGRDGATFGTGTIFGTNEVYDPVANTWTVKAPMLTPLSDVYATVGFGGKVYVLGGFQGPPVNNVVGTVQIYDPASNSWTYGADMPTKRAAAMAGICDSKIHVFGGYNGINLAVTEIYDPATNLWNAGGPGPSLVVAASEMAQGPTQTSSNIYAIGSGLFGPAANLAQAETCCVTPVKFCLRIGPKGGLHVPFGRDVNIYIDNEVDAFDPDCQPNGISVGGFSFLFSYDCSCLQFLGASKGQMLLDQKWEFFTFRFGALGNGNCGSGCPSCLIRVVAIADINNSNVHPMLSPPRKNKGQWVCLRFRTSNDLKLSGRCCPINWYWLDCTDNTISDSTGNCLWIACSLKTPEDSVINLATEFPTVNVANCDTVQTDCRKPKPKKFIVFKNGKICLPDVDTLDARGDINLNGVANEIADAVLFENYFLYGAGVFIVNLDGQVVATDVNGDGRPLQVADLVGLIRIITGDANPLPRLSPAAGAVSLAMTASASEVSVSANSASDIGGLALRFKVNGTAGAPVLSAAAEGMTLKSNLVGDELSVLIFTDENHKNVRIAPDAGKILTVPVSGNIELVESDATDYYGISLPTLAKGRALPTQFGLSQNFPNPFNPKTSFVLALPVASEYSVTIYNVAGQAVKRFSGSAQAGNKVITWDGTDNNGVTVSSGIYFYRALAGKYSDVKRMMFLK